MKKESEYTKWVACWGNATSITDRKEATFAKDLTLRYPLFMPFEGSRIRLRFSNLTGTEPVTLTRGFVALNQDDYVSVPILFSEQESVTINPGCEVESDEIPLLVPSGSTLNVSMYFQGFTQLNAGTLITGPLSTGKYSYGDFTREKDLPLDLTRNTNWFYFLNTVDILTEEKNHALVCYGDSITAQSWPVYLTLRA